jgi:hypothetical protein
VRNVRNSHFGHRNQGVHHGAPIRPKALAGKLNEYVYNPHFRAVLRRMVEDNLIEKFGDGVRRCANPRVTKNMR